MDISDYDKFGYDYSNYWNEREYENEAERIVLDKVFDNIPTGKWFLDIGGSFGRLADTYYKRFKHPIILDYSIETLKKNSSVLKESYPNVILIAANAYYLPFKESSIDGALMVRVLHHINEPEKYFREISKALKSNAVYIQEFANKVHIKAKVKAILKGNFKFFSKEPYQQPTAGNFEGTNGKEGIFLNYHPKYIKDLLKRSKFRIKDKYGCSYLRIPSLKKLLNQKSLVKIERLLQKTLSWTNISPSIFFVGESIKKTEGIRNYSKLEDLLVCPKCKEELCFNDNTAECFVCGNKYRRDEGIWDFRIIE